jgi:hypothetical protein
MDNNAVNTAMPLTQDKQKVLGGESNDENRVSTVSVNPNNGNIDNNNSMRHYKQQVLG